MATMTKPMQGCVNAGRWVTAELRVEQEWIDVSSDRATKPDMSWVFTDAAGHWHAYDLDGDLPTLVDRSRHIPCDGVHLFPGDFSDCEGYDVTEWFCRVCDEQVEPRRLPDPGPHRIKGMTNWTVVLYGAVPFGPDKVQVSLLDASGQVRFGIAVCTEVESSSLGGTRSTLVGVSKLGARRAAREEAAK